jgi:hypothetical protein
MSDGFQAVNFANLQWPAEVRVDYIRVYQVEGEENIGCDPKDFPTADYIDKSVPSLSSSPPSSETGRVVFGRISS